jgi:structural maintenance of chromosomes protein 5
MLITEVILENFMSYEYARVAFKPGVNLIVGPNGAGKSSLLLAISVALGQTYTERSKKLSNLIRWGKDQARVTVILDNTKQKNGRRPVPKYSKDQIFLSRFLRRDGQYWFELENRAAGKQDVQRLLARFGVDPDNMLIIMHQNMVEQFSVLSNTEKLRMVEAAVGLEPFRDNVVQAQQKLTRILSQEESVSKLLESAQQTLNYWREQYDKYQEKKQLQTKRRFLERELAWAEVERRETAVKELEAENRRIQQSLERVEKEAKTTSEELDKEYSEQIKLKQDSKTAFANRLNAEHAIARDEATMELVEQLAKEAALVEEALKGAKAVSLKVFQSENLKILLKTAGSECEKGKEKAKDLQNKLRELEEAIDKITGRAIDNRIQMALLEYRKENAKTDLEKVEAQVKTAKATLEAATSKASESGARIAATKSALDIQDEIRMTDGHLAALAGINEDIERMYESYSKLFLELKEKAQVVSENRSKALEEVSTRLQAWRTVMQDLLDRVNLEYQRIMSQTRAAGEVRLGNAQDIQTAGLEILVGFKGGKPVPLDAYTQSGGERTTATMSFLLALQHHVRSPFRAVDEYDIHMDPQNREMIAKILISNIKDASAQYIVITPSQVTFAEENANLVTVQNVEGKSVVREVR